MPLKLVLLVLPSRDVLYGSNPVPRPNIWPANNGKRNCPPDFSPVLPNKALLEKESRRATFDHVTEHRRITFKVLSVYNVGNTHLEKLRFTVSKHLAEPGVNTSELLALDVRRRKTHRCVLEHRIEPDLGRA